MAEIALTTPHPAKLTADDFFLLPSGGGVAFGETLTGATIAGLKIATDGLA